MELKQEKFENVLVAGRNYSIPDLSVDERNFVFAFFERYGLKRSRVYNRIFRAGHGSGFDEWELCGIRSLIAEFERQQGIRQSSECELSTFYFNRLDGLREKFWNFMACRGMSKATCIFRFKNWNFQEWELCGVRSLLHQVCKRKEGYENVS